MSSNTRSSRHTCQSSDVVLLSEADMPVIKRTAKKDSKPKQKNQRKENCPINLGDIIEISSDEDEEPVVPRSGVATSKLQDKIRQLEQENARMRKENEEMKKRQMLEAADMEDQVTCEVCSTKMWSPFILPDCGHTFCQQDLENWFSTTLNQHRTLYPHGNVNIPAMNLYGAAPPPLYTCPKCRETVRSRPIQNFALKGFVRSIAAKAGEYSPKKTTGSSVNVWNRFFPATR
ncbi:hypothetical protein B0H10DRAFT_2222818 [Mycena sp. CBHHK59/15]|nr:hypothetical protein B0H10DRAFT_2222818 [Mycena sp. CBHHK59/15]